MTVNAAPMPWGIAINEGTGECAGYWGGDEFHNNPLPDGWIEYYPGYVEQRDDSIIITPIGNCDFTRDDAKACCKEIGLEYVADNIGVGRTIQQKIESTTTLMEEGYGDTKYLGDGKYVTEKGGGMIAYRIMPPVEVILIILAIILVVSIALVWIVIKYFKKK